MDLNYENKLIKEEAENIFEKFLEHADWRQLDEEYVVEKFIKELQAIERKRKIY